VIYLDHHATSPVHPLVLEAMRPWWTTPANPSSVHAAGRRAARAIEEAAEQVAALVGKVPRDVVFTSGATEANALWFHAMRVAGQDQIAIGGTEHPSVTLHAPGAHVLPVSPDGQPLPDAHPVDGRSVMAANHETGVQTELARFLALDGWLHVDATAAAGRMPLALAAVDAVTLSAHKIGGPVGVGALVSPHHDLAPLFQGAQQRGRRGGTLNTAGIVGFGCTARLAREELSARTAAWRVLQERLEALVVANGGRIVGVDRVPTVVNAVFPGLPAEAVVQALDLQGIATSAGAACSSGSVSASPVLTAMGDPEPAGGVRFSLGWSSTVADVEAVERVLPGVLAGARLFL
jgi:cysteine desulfurase